MKKLILLALHIAMLFFGFGQVSETQTQPEMLHSGQDKSRPKTVALKFGEPAEVVTYDAGTARFLASSADTNGAWSLVELTEKPGYKTPLHRHNSTT